MSWSRALHRLFPWTDLLLFWLPCLILSGTVYLFLSNGVFVLFVLVNLGVWIGAIQWQFNNLFFQLKLLYITVIGIEIFLQLLAVFHLLPGLNIKHDVPFGRVYWTKEGDGVNSRMNRFGWYAMESLPEEGKKRIVLIGDSMVEGVQVEKSEKLDTRLQEVLNTPTSSETQPVQVFSLGHSGAYPGSYLEYIRHALRYYQPHEIIVFITVWNDFLNALKVRQSLDYSYIYYDVRSSGELYLLPESKAAIDQLHAHLERNRSFAAYLWMEAVRGHLLLPWMVRKVRFLVEQKGGATASFVEEQKTQPSAQRFEAGGNGFIYEKTLHPDARHALAINLKLLEEMLALTQSHGVRLRLVTIPHFPLFFYQEAPDRSWSAEFDDLDLFLPEKHLVTFAQRHKIPLLPGGQRIQEEGVDKQTIHGWYFRGIGHWTPAGHAQFARMLDREWGAVFRSENR
ncbi:MAG: hypothetical protein G8237_11465 [Magnetococcales bacterium]|nr:hypothetical protein [Magnetococcales bacterium]